MKSLLGSSFLLSLCLAVGSVRAAAPEAPSAEASLPNDLRLGWWREARFGMFIHWGLYSVAAGEWEGKSTSGAGEWLMNDLAIPLSHYAKLAPRFNPVRFDAHQWVGLAREAGMKYIVITTKHHDGFGLFHSTHTDWCLTATPFEREPLKELAQACQENGIKLGFYYSIMDWHHPDYAPRKPWNDLAIQSPDFDRYLTFMKGQLQELLTGYGPVSVLWFDGQWENTWTYDRGFDLYRYVRGLQPDLIVNNRIGTELPLQAGQRSVGDYRTPEQSIPANGFGPGVDWETCMTMNNTWGFKASDHDWKPTQTLVRNLIDCASKGGNYLLNVGPTGEGLIPAPSVERLKQIGRWLKVNGPAIYGTAASPFPRAFAWGRCTVKSSPRTTTLYLHVFEWPADHQLLLPGLRNQAIAARLLVTPDNPLPTEAGEDGLTLTLPSTPPDPLSSTIEVCLLGTPRIAPTLLLQKRDGSVTLPASEARLHGSTLQYESGGPLDDIGYWTTPEDWADWEFKLNRPGRFTVSAMIAAPASATFEISIAGQTLRCAGPATGNYVSFKLMKLGSVDLRSPGKLVLTVRPVKEGWQPMNLKAIRLEPAKHQSAASPY